MQKKPTDDITVKQTNKSKPSIIKFQNESQMQQNKVIRKDTQMQ